MKKFIIIFILSTVLISNTLVQAEFKAQSEFVVNIAATILAAKFTEKVEEGSTKLDIASTMVHEVTKTPEYETMVTDISKALVEAVFLGMHVSAKIREIFSAGGPLAEIGKILDDIKKPK